MIYHGLFNNKIKYYKYRAKAETPWFYRFKIWRILISCTIFCNLGNFRLSLLRLNVTSIENIVVMYDSSNSGTELGVILLKQKHHGFLVARRGECYFSWTALIPWKPQSSRKLLLLARRPENLPRIP